jgi:GGDEF domain-containing protein
MTGPSTMIGDESLLHPLTGLYSASYMDRRIEEELGHARRQHGKICLLRLALLPPVLPPDLLKEAADLLRLGLRTADLLGHGHDGQFLALLPATPLQSAIVAAQRLQKAVEEWGFDSALSVVLGFRAAEAGGEDSRESLLERLAGS